MLIIDIEKAVLQMNQVFQSNGLNNTEKAFPDAFILNDADHKYEYLKVIGCEFMPFELRATGNAV